MVVHAFSRLRPQHSAQFSKKLSDRRVPWKRLTVQPGDRGFFTLCLALCRDHVGRKREGGRHDRLLYLPTAVLRFANILGRIINPITPPAEPHFVTLC